MLDSAEEFHSADVVFAIEYLLRRLAPIDSSVQSGSLMTADTLALPKISIVEAYLCFLHLFIASMEILDCELKSTTEKTYIRSGHYCKTVNSFCIGPGCLNGLKTASGFLPTDKEFFAY